MARSVSEDSLWWRIEPKQHRPFTCTDCGQVADSGWRCVAGQEKGEAYCLPCWRKVGEEKEDANGES